MTDLGQAKRFLGIDVEIKSTYIKLHMAGYIDSMLQELDMMNCNSNPLPWKPSVKLDVLPDDTDEDCDETEYRSIVGKLLYAATTVRFDLAFYVLKLSQYFKSPKVKHMQAALSVVKYLKGTKHFGIVYEENSSPNLMCYSDADFASQTDVLSRSTTGFLITYAGAPFSWKSKLQTIVAVSTLNAEAIALYQTIQEAVWLSNLLGELGFDHEVEAFCDNDGVIKTIKKSSFPRRLQTHQGKSGFCATESPLARIVYRQGRYCRQHLRHAYQSTRLRYL